MNADEGFEGARKRLMAAAGQAQAAMVDVVDAAAEFDALQPAHDRAEWPLDAGALLAHLAVRVMSDRYGPGDRFALHLRYYRGQRFLGERPDGLLAALPRPRGLTIPPGRSP